jgi:hypothetical protein
MSVKNNETLTWRLRQVWIDVVSMDNGSLLEFSLGLTFYCSAKSNDFATFIVLRVLHLMKNFSTLR